MAFKTKKNNKTLKCRACNQPVERVGADAGQVTCWQCVIQSQTKAPLLEKLSGPDCQESR